MNMSYPNVNNRIFKYQNINSNIHMYVSPNLSHFNEFFNYSTNKIFLINS